MTVPSDLFAGRYRCDALLGEGGFKSVWRAHDVILGRDVALAIYRFDRSQQEAANQILHEARALARLGDSPRIVTVFDVGASEGTPYLVTRLMTGGDLLTILQHSPGRHLSPKDAVAIASDVLEALHTAHAERVIHRDVTPNNIWLDRQGRAVLGDFGIAAGGAAGHSTQLSEAAGKIPYMAPEVLQGDKASVASDLYSLGCTLYEALTGRTPFHGDVSAQIAQHVTEEPAPPSHFAREISPSLDRAVLELLAKHPADRPASALDATNTLRRAMSGGRNLPKREMAQRGAVTTVAADAATAPRPTKRIAPAPTTPARLQHQSSSWWRNWTAAALVALVIFVPLVVFGVLRALDEQGSDRQVSVTPTAAGAPSAPAITDFTVYNNVFELREEDFTLGENVAACFSMRPRGNDTALVVVVTNGSAPATERDASILGRSDSISVTGESSCYPVAMMGNHVSDNGYTAWIMQGEQQLARDTFRTAPIEDTRANVPSPTPAPPPTPPPATPTPIPTPRPTWMVVQGLPLEPWECANVRPQPAQDPALNCLVNGTVVRVIGEPRTVDGRLWWPVNFGGWMAEDYLALTNAPAATAIPTRTIEDVTRSFYENLAQKRWPVAYQHLSARYQRQNPYPYGVWVRGFNTTESVDVESVRRGTTDSVVAVFRATDRVDGSQDRLTRRYMVTWRLVSEAGQWRLDTALVQELPLESPEPTATAPPISTPAPTARFTPSPTTAPPENSNCIELVSWRINIRFSWDEVVGEVRNTCRVGACITFESVAYRDSQGAIVSVSTLRYGHSRLGLAAGESRPFLLTANQPSNRDGSPELVSKVEFANSTTVPRC